jgi:hypothetical protein
MPYIGAHCVGTQKVDVAAVGVTKQFFSSAVKTNINTPNFNKKCPFFLRFFNLADYL